MEQVAPGVHRIPLTPRNGVNAYLVGDVLVDAGTNGAKGLLKALGGRAVRAHAATHAHADHVGGSAEVTAKLEVPMWIGDHDAEALCAGAPETKPGVVAGMLRRLGGWPPVDAQRRLVEGDELAEGFVVLETPGHSPGHLAFWRESDRVLITGDVLFNFDLKTTRYGLREPPGPFTFDVERNRESIRRVASLEPAVVGFGHGPLLRDPATLRAFADAV
jgi:hydroxyacylglutathione hydrolase